MANPSTGDRHSTVLTGLLSTITSPAFSELVIAVARYETHLPWSIPLFGELRATHEVRYFKLVFLLETLGLPEAERELVEALDLVASNGLLDFLYTPPTIRIPRPRHYMWDSSISIRHRSHIPYTTTMALTDF